MLGRFLFIACCTLDCMCIRIESVIYNPYQLQAPPTISSFCKPSSRSAALRSSMLLETICNVSSDNILGIIVAISNEWGAEAPHHYYSSRNSFRDLKTPGHPGGCCRRRTVVVVVVVRESARSPTCTP